MFALNSVLVLFLMIFYVSNCQRRIKDGQDLKVDRRYVVYLVKAPLSSVGYDTWLCGGAIVTAQFVITSAACVNDVNFLYVIAGYKKYVPDSEIETDKCTSKMKKKVIYTCSPKGYKLKYGELDYWSFVDIALVKVESEFAFDDPTYETMCSYKPTTISINFEEKYQEAGTDALILGWGHKDNWRKYWAEKKCALKKQYTQLAASMRRTGGGTADNLPALSALENRLVAVMGGLQFAVGNPRLAVNPFPQLPRDKSNYNQPTLKYAPTLLLDKDACIQHYEDYANMTNVIKTYMVCSLGKGNIDDEGNPIQQSLPLQNGCTSQQQKLLGFEGVSCEKGSTEGSSDEDETRRYVSGSNQTDNVTLNDFNTKHARRSGICQNDHGGPLITWAGSTEILIGVASVFKVSEEYECMGPYLYTSTRCTGLFLDCILRSELPARRDGRRYLCDRPASERGYDTIERTISWKDHPAGSAENENIERSGPRPKISPGLEYLTNNNNQPPNVENDNSNNTFQAYKYLPIINNAPKEVQEEAPENIQKKEPKYESNKMYLANNNPVVVRDEPKEMYAEHKSILGEERFSVNERQQEATQYESNNQYSAISSNAHNGRFKIMERIPESNIPGKQHFLVNDRSPEPNFQVNDRSSRQHTFLANEKNPYNRYPSNETNLAIVRHPGIQSSQANQRYPANQRFPENGRYPVSVGSTKNLQRIPTGISVRSVRPLRN